MAQKRLVPSKDLTERGPPTKSIKSSQLDLTDDIRRHIVVGIALNNYLVPQLKEFVDQKMKEYYEQLVNQYKINTSQSELNAEVIKKERLGLNIFDRGKLLSNIGSHNELSAAAYDQKLQINSG